MLKPKLRDYGKIIYGGHNMYRWKCYGYGGFGVGLTAIDAYERWRSDRCKMKGYGIAAARRTREAAEQRIKNREARRAASAAAKLQLNPLRSNAPEPYKPTFWERILVRK